jgi:mevalonate kinase
MEANAVITKVLLPRIRQLEQEVAELRKQTWPYVQAQKEDMGLRDMQELVEFFKDLDNETILKLMRMKRKFSRNPGLQGREIDIVMSLRNNFC